MEARISRNICNISFLSRRNQNMHSYGFLPQGFSTLIEHQAKIMSSRNSRFLAVTTPPPIINKWGDSRIIYKSPNPKETVLTFCN